MIRRTLSKHSGLAAIGFGMIGAVIYLLMINVTLANIETVSGHIPFDMRPFGYNFAEAEAFLSALGIEGREYYLIRQIPLDTLYPAILALTLISTLSWFELRMPNSKLVGMGIIFSIGAALFDYGENLCIVAMIWNWPALQPSLVQTASSATIVKSALTTLAALTTFVVGLNWMRLCKADV